MFFPSPTTPRTPCDSLSGVRVLSLRYRVRWLELPVTATAVGVALAARVQDDDLWAPIDLGAAAVLWAIFVAFLAVPVAITLGMVRTVVGWTVAVLALTVGALYLPISFGLDESSTRGLAFIVPILYGVPLAVALGLIDGLARRSLSPRRAPAPPPRR
jgi:hypothetical protein